MNVKKILMLPFWILMIALPVVVCLVGLQYIPIGVEQIPTHWNFAGEVNGWGSPSETMILGYIMAGTNAMMALCYYGTNWLYAHGMVSNATPRGARITLVVTAVFLVLLTAGIEVFTISSVLGAL